MDKILVGMDGGGRGGQVFGKYPLCLTASRFNGSAARIVSSYIPTYLHIYLPTYILNVIFAACSLPTTLV